MLLASLGGTLEFYDFVIFGIFAKDIADAIFPNPTPLISLMVSFAAFAAGYLARPIGGIVLSHFGDRFGRRRVFLISIFVMSGATLGMGLVPSFATWGAAASVLMVVLRLVQGFCLGGELPGALTYVVETAPRQAPFVCGVVFSCVTLGVAVATGVSLAVRTWLPAELVATLGWRIAFVLGGLGGLLSFALRRSLEESPEFARMKQLASRQPFREVLRTHLGRSRWASAGSPRPPDSTACSSRTWRPTCRASCATTRARPSSRRRSASSSTPSGFWRSDASPNTCIRGCCCARARSRWWCWRFRSTPRSPPGRMNPTLLLVLAGVCASLVNGTFAVLLTDLFPTRVRFSGVALGFNVAFTIFSGTAPLVATSLIRSTGLTTAPAFVMVGCGLLTLVGSFWLSRDRRPRPESSAAFQM